MNNSSEDIGTRLLAAVDADISDVFVRACAHANRVAMLIFPDDPDDIVIRNALDRDEQEMAQEAHASDSFWRARTERHALEQAVTAEVKAWIAHQPEFEAAGGYEANAIDALYDQHNALALADVALQERIESLTIGQARRIGGALAKQWRTEALDRQMEMRRQAKANAAIVSALAPRYRMVAGGRRWEMENIADAREALERLAATLPDNHQWHIGLLVESGAFDASSRARSVLAAEFGRATGGLDDTQREA